MATHAKRKLTETFDPRVTKTNPAAAFNSPKTTKRRASTDVGQSAAKRQKRPAEKIKEALENQFHDHIFNQIAASTNRQDTYETLCSLNKMPPVVI